MSEKTKTKTPPVALGKSEQIIELFCTNIDAMRLWYRRQATPGPETGVYVNMELNLANIQTALRFAIQGKTWTEPSQNP